MKHTPAPWVIGEYSDTLGYDCMTGAIRVGPLMLDGADYGQRSCEKISADGLARMMADAHLIAAAHDMLSALQDGLDLADGFEGISRNNAMNLLSEFADKARAAIAKAQA